MGATCSCEEECESGYNACIDDCQSNPVPDPYGFLTKQEYLARLCYPGCMETRIACLKTCEGTPEEQADWLGQAEKFISDHGLELVIGAVIVLGGVTIVVLAGPGGIPVLGLFAGA